MAVPQETIWEMEPHTAAKHEVLRRYFEAWLPIMASWSGRVIYIDGFAGPGRYRGGEPGSPLVAIDAALKHRAAIKAEVVFLFVENRPDRHKHLESELALLTLPANFKVAARCGNFDEALTGMMDDLEQQRKAMVPTFAFIDPFGFSHTPFSVVSRLLANPRCEVLITFMYEAINRFLGHPDHEATYDRLFGATHWRMVMRSADPTWRRNMLHDIYREQLHVSAGAHYVRSFEMRDEGNRTEYFLFFATNNLLGLKRMKAAMWKVDPAGAFRFADSSNPAQAVLFEAQPNVEALRAALMRQFAGRDASVEEIEEFVVAETPFRESHYRKQILRPLEAADPPGLLVVKAPPGRKRYTYPGGTMVHLVQPQQ